MVETTSTTSLTQDITAEERIRVDRVAADICRSNMLALIKLRQLGVSEIKKLPKDVFRCILEYHFPNELLWRYSDPYVPIEGRQQDRHFPSTDKLNYDNFLVALNEILDVEWLFVLRDGAFSGTKGGKDNWTLIQLS